MLKEAETDHPRISQAEIDQFNQAKAAHQKSLNLLRMKRLVLMDEAGQVKHGINSGEREALQAMDDKSKRKIVLKNSGVFNYLKPFYENDWNKVYYASKKNLNLYFSPLFIKNEEKILKRIEDTKGQAGSRLPTLNRSNLSTENDSNGSRVQFARLPKLNLSDLRSNVSLKESLGAQTALDRNETKKKADHSELVASKELLQDTSGMSGEQFDLGQDALNADSLVYEPETEVNPLQQIKSRDYKGFTLPKLSKNLIYSDSPFCEHLKHKSKWFKKNMEQLESQISLKRNQSLSSLRHLSVTNRPKERTSRLEKKEDSVTRIGTEWVVKELQRYETICDSNKYVITSSSKYCQHDTPELKLANIPTVRSESTNPKNFAKLSYGHN